MLKSKLNFTRLSKSIKVCVNHTLVLHPDLLQVLTIDINFAPPIKLFGEHPSESVQTHVDFDKNILTNFVFKVEETFNNGVHSCELSDRIIVN